MLTAFTAAFALTPLEEIQNAVVLVEDGCIVRAGAREAIELPANVRVADYGENVLAPGLVDIHIHGAAGHDVMRANPSERAAMEAQLARCGVTSYYPTTVTAPQDFTLRALAEIGAAIEQSSDAGARAVGIHLEGPFISRARRGVHSEAQL